MNAPHQRTAVAFSLYFRVVAFTLSKYTPTFTRIQTFGVSAVLRRSDAADDADDFTEVVERLARPNSDDLVFGIGRFQTVIAGTVAVFNA